jgi:opacity protein-like surface antigen
VKLLALLALLVLLPACATDKNRGAEQLNAAKKQNRVSIYAGKRQLDHSEWSPIDEPLAYGFDYAHVPNAIGFEVGAQFSRDTEEEGGVDVEGNVTEVSAGFRVQAGDDVIRPYGGAGLAYLSAKTDSDAFASDDDQSLAGYAHFGITADLGPAFFVGVDARILFGSSLELFDENTDADYAQLAVVMGFAF